MELTDGIIILKPFELEDARAHLAGEDKDQIDWLNEGKESTVGSVENWIKRNKEYWEKSGPVFNFAIWVDKKLVGMVEANTDYKKVKGLKEGDANISYSLYPEARGKGYATMAVNLLLDFLKNKELDRAILRIEAENKPSLGIPKRIGFVDSGEIVTEDGKQLLIFTKSLTE